MSGSWHGCVQTVRFFPRGHLRHLPAGRMGHLQFSLYGQTGKSPADRRPLPFFQPVDRLHGPGCHGRQPITFMLAWEIMSLSSFFLVIYDYESAKTAGPDTSILCFPRSAPCLSWPRSALIYAHTGSFAFIDAAAALPDRPKSRSLCWLYRVRLQGRCFPLSCLAAPCPPGRPSHISAVMSGVMIKTGIYGIVRIYALLDWHTP
jgi:hypothetical protein